MLNPLHACSGEEGQDMAQRRQIAPYKSDILGLLFEVDEVVAYVNETSRGWQVNSFPSGFTPRLPKRLTPRHVEGFESTSGLRRKAIVADTSATLWTGAST